VSGVHIGRLDSFFMVGALITALSGVYFGLAACRAGPPDVIPALAPTPASTGG
jgi:hypothetical protein